MSNFKLKLRQPSLPLLVPACWAGCSRRILMLREECHRGRTEVEREWGWHKGKGEGKEHERRGHKKVSFWLSFWAHKSWFYTTLTQPLTQ